MTSPEKLSVLLPVYNTPSDWLIVAIESVLKQTLNFPPDLVLGFLRPV